MRIPTQFGQRSDLIRTAIQSISDTDPIQFGQRSEGYSDSFSAPSDDCPKSFGTVSEMRRIRAAEVA